MGRGKALSIIRLHSGGVSLHDITRRTGRARTFVRKAIKTEPGLLPNSVSPSPRPGRRPALTEREARLLVRKAATGDRFAAKLKTELGPKASMRTV
ncbi:hypothetical protein PHYSODRAFT_510324 [Phytophthora sojae]|uniref:Tc3 transposase DNA binding domain-containing protein n=1 Tax=Phytophthora sojae (strain P6497) TaxID=1094619 RepID=G4ZLY5_PHYSP|nr:hypothetical protein PHYSODRAFT_510324 [Phytophthora sojae]EGZ15614.1 hypothetical protein PHYSODRAFT_510324 [Phytophthora sojae]|eukprot:XP_009529363.1 hypothetical protein PHYSODRAFT_510324 [Phytophthora sojae]